MFWGKYENAQSNTVCFIENYNIDNTDKRIIPVHLDDTLMSNNNMRMCMVGYNDFGGHIVVSSFFLELPKTIIEPLLWHEVGHLHYAHHFDSTAGATELRMKAIQDGKVIKEELEADEFSLRYSSKSKLRKALKFTLKTRPKGKGKNDMGHLELKLRIKNLSKKD